MSDIVKNSKPRTAPKIPPLTVPNVLDRTFAKVPPPTRWALNWAGKQCRIS
jgi:hypothetical protein